MGGIRNKDHQIKTKDTIPQIDDLEIEDVFKGEDEEEGMGVMDFINGLVEILRLETKELRDAAWQTFTPVEPWDEGQVTWWVMLQVQNMGTWERRNMGMW